MSSDLWSGERHGVTITATVFGDNLCVVTAGDGMKNGWRIVSAWYQESDRAIETAVLLANAGEDAVRAAHRKGIVVRGVGDDVEDWRKSP